DRAVLADRVDRSEAKPSSSARPGEVKKPNPRIDTAEWMKGGEPERPLSPQNARAFDELGLDATDANDDPEADRIVRSFRAKRFLRAAFVSSIGASALAITLGYIVAFAGPEDNAARRYAVTYGLLPGQASAQKAAAEYHLAAHREYDRGDVVDLDRAI